MKIGVGNICVEKNKIEKSRKYMSAEHLVVSNKFVATFTIIF
jgi:hypothetical protein